MTVQGRVRCVGGSVSAAFPAESFLAQGGHPWLAGFSRAGWTWPVADLRHSSLWQWIVQDPVAHAAAKPVLAEGQATGRRVQFEIDGPAALAWMAEHRLHVIVEVLLGQVPVGSPAELARAGDPEYLAAEFNLAADLLPDDATVRRIAAGLTRMREFASANRVRDLRTLHRLAGYVLVAGCTELDRARLYRAAGIDVEEAAAMEAAGADRPGDDALRVLAELRLSAWRQQHQIA